MQSNLQVGWYILYNYICECMCLLRLYVLEKFNSITFGLRLPKNLTKILNHFRMDYINAALCGLSVRLKFKRRKERNLHNIIKFYMLNSLLIFIQYGHFCFHNKISRLFNINRYMNALFI